MSMSPDSGETAPPPPLLPPPSSEETGARRASASHVAWRQSLGAGLLLGLALGCGWLARWTPHWYPRLLLALLSAAMALLGLALLLSASENWPWALRVQRLWHERLGGAGFPFFAALVLLALAALATGNNLLYLLVSGLIAALVVSGIATALNLSGLELSFDLPSELYAEREVVVPFQLLNTKTWWPAYSITVQASCSGSGRGEQDDAVMQTVYFPYFGRGGRARAEGHMLFPRRGRYTGATFVCATRFPFGLLQKRRRFQERRRDRDTGPAEPAENVLIVYPAPVPGLRLPAGLRQRALAAVAAARRGEGQDIYRIRRHVAGEAARRVDWKASARTSSLHVREYLEEQTPRVRLRLLRQANADPSSLEPAISLCAGWVLALASESVLLEFAGDYAAPPGERGEHAERGLHLGPAPAADLRRPILEYLSTVDATADVVPPEWALAPVEHEIIVGARIG